MAEPASNAPTANYIVAKAGATGQIDGEPLYSGHYAGATKFLASLGNPPLLKIFPAYVVEEKK